MRKSIAAVLGAATVVSLGLLLSACGGGSTPGVASLGTTTTTAASSSQSTGASGTTSTKREAGIRFSRCMRSHGVPNFPDPTAGTGTGGVRISPNSGIDPNSPAFRAASKACQSLVPKPSAAQVRQAEQNALKFSKCMRSHGVPNFPDPQFSTGGAAIKISANGGLRPTSPTFQAAQQACSKYVGLPKGKAGKQGAGVTAVAP